MIRCLMIGFALAFSSLEAMEPLPESYTIRFGRPGAPNQVVEYVSVGCPTCHRLFREEFGEVSEKILIPGKATWVFHVVPDDVLSCQLAFTLQRLEGRELEKRNLFAKVMRQCDGDYIANIGRAQRLMREALSRNGLSTDFIDDPDALREDKRVDTVLAYLAQDDAIRDVPTVQINGKVFDEVPT